MTLLERIHRDAQATYVPAELFIVLINKAEAAGFDLNAEVDPFPYGEPWIR